MAKAATSQERVMITIRGIVQGVGFRPFIFCCAAKYKLAGYVYNDRSGVVIDAEGDANSIHQFIIELSRNHPPLAVVDTIDVMEQPMAEYERFVIKASNNDGQGFIPLSPDMATCPDCLKEMKDPKDPRFLYPFINCTNCGPRFSIMEDIPYDRPKTSMKAFPMCRRCEEEYADPGNRRFHAQPLACPECGPGLAFKEARAIDCTQLRWSSSPAHVATIIEKAVNLLKAGKVLALKGLGGYHLAVNALDPDAIIRLWDKKQRYGKPLALMMKSIDDVRRYCIPSPQEEALLTRPQHPIVILKAKPGKLPNVISPGLDTVGVMLPYTPLHHLLLSNTDFPLVMTSANISEEPICKENDEAFIRLAGIADGFLFHNRPIVNRIDDSVCFYAAGSQRMVRRARGYVPEPLRLLKAAPSLIACGPFYKNTFCLAQGEYAFLSQHIGDLDSKKPLYITKSR